MKKERLLTWTGIAVTIGSLVLVYGDITLVTLASERTFLDLLQASTVAVLITALVYGSLVYLFARTGYFKRTSDTAPLDQIEDELLSSSAPPKVAILIPSYKEE